MKTYYKVESSFYDDGKESIQVYKIRSTSKPRDKQYEMENKDYYIDYFETIEEVELFLIDNENITWNI